jgi:hypothetical protein
VQVLWGTKSDFKSVRVAEKLTFHGTSDRCVLHIQNLANGYFNPLTPELNPSAQRCLTIFFTGDFAY